MFQPNLVHARPSDWTAYNLAAVKYPCNDSGNERFPFGWESRKNSVSLEVLLFPTQLKLYHTDCNVTATSGRKSVIY